LEWTLCQVAQLDYTRPHRWGIIRSPGQTPHTTHKKMSDTLTTLKTQHDVLEDSIKTMMEQMININTQIKVEEDKINAATSWNSFLKTEIREVLKDYPAVENITNMVMDALDVARRKGDYRKLIDVYRRIGCRHDAKLRQFVKLVVACDSIKFYSGMIDSTYKWRRKVSLEQMIANKKSTLRYTMLCPECGSIATNLYNRMKQEGLV
jgi:hypothetical protein